MNEEYFVEIWCRKIFFTVSDSPLNKSLADFRHLPKKEKVKD